MWKRQDWGQPRGTGSPGKNGWEVMTTKNILHHVLHSPDLHHASPLTTFCGTNWSCFFQSSWKCLTLLYKFKGLGFILNPPILVLLKVWRLISIAGEIFSLETYSHFGKTFFPTCLYPIQAASTKWDMNLAKNRMRSCKERQCQCTYRSLNYNNPFYFAHDFYFCLPLLWCFFCMIYSEYG